MELSTKKLFTSEVKPGIRYTLRVLNVIQRAKRDLSIVNEQMEYAELSQEYTELCAPVTGQKLADLPSDLRMKISRLQTRMNLIVDASIKPATIKAALISIEEETDGKWTALKLDGIRLTGDTFCDTDLYEALVDEMFTNASSITGMTPEQGANFPLPSDSQGPGDGASPLTTASSANDKDSIPLETA